MTNINIENSDHFICDYAVLIKKMRLLRRLNRQQAALLFDFSFKNIEKLENGRGTITLEKFKDFQSKYKFSDQEVEDLRSGKTQAPTDANIIRKNLNSDGKRLGRRFKRKHVSRECKVLKELRLQIGIDQYSASRKCRFGINTIGWIENGRVELTNKKIQHIVLTYGFTMEYFNGLLKINPLRHEMIEQSKVIIEELDENKLRAIMPILQSMK
ncbi:MAG: helix-turn-helix domain-containing protein [Bacteriovoracaceae bacterium]|jgi:transcriptional regulator with XRE-family HTH domain|nr:helix-turn-helix domain-containing protein [Bacteriovoracaceae bacterium]